MYQRVKHIGTNRRAFYYEEIRARTISLMSDFPRWKPIRFHTRWESTSERTERDTVAEGKKLYLLLLWPLGNRRGKESQLRKSPVAGCVSIGKSGDPARIQTIRRPSKIIPFCYYKIMDILPWLGRISMPNSKLRIGNANCSILI